MREGEVLLQHREFLESPIGRLVHLVALVEVQVYQLVVAGGILGKGRHGTNVELQRLYSLVRNGVLWIEAALKPGVVAAAPEALDVDAPWWLRRHISGIEHFICCMDTSFFCRCLGICIVVKVVEHHFECLAYADVANIAARDNVIMPWFCRPIRAMA